MNNKTENPNSDTQLENIKESTRGLHIIKWLSFLLSSVAASLFLLMYMPSWVAILCGHLFGSFTYGFIHQMGERHLDELTKEWSKKRQEETYALYGDATSKLSETLKSYSDELKEKGLVDDWDDDDGNIH